MIKNNLPSWALQYATKGHTIRTRKDGSLLLFKVSSHRVPGLKYPKVHQEYLGIITPEGLINKKVRQSPIDFCEEYIEYGLSHFLYTNFKRFIIRHFFGCAKERAEAIIRFTIIYYLYGSIDQAFFNLSYISKEYMLTNYLNMLTTRRLSSIYSLKKLIDKELIIRLESNDNLLLLISSLKQVMTYKKDGSYIIPTIPKTLSDLIIKKGWNI